MGMRNKNRRREGGVSLIVRDAAMTDRKVLDEPSILTGGTQRTIGVRITRRSIGRRGERLAPGPEGILAGKRKRNGLKKSDVEGHGRPERGSVESWV